MNRFGPTAAYHHGSPHFLSVWSSQTLGSYRLQLPFGASGIEETAGVGIFVKDAKVLVNLRLMRSALLVFCFLGVRNMARLSSRICWVCTSPCIFRTLCGDQNPRRKSKDIFFRCLFDCVHTVLGRVQPYASLIGINTFTRIIVCSMATSLKLPKLSSNVHQCIWKFDLSGYSQVARSEASRMIKSTVDLEPSVLWSCLGVFANQSICKCLSQCMVDCVIRCTDSTAGLDRVSACEVK